MTYSRCSKHKILYETGKRCPECRKLYNKNRNDRELIKFYQSKEWKMLREKVINFYCGIDIFALGLTGKITPCGQSITVHHIIEYKKNTKLGLDFNNLVPVSNLSHSEIHKMYDNGQREEALKIIDRGRAVYNNIRNGNKNKKIT